MELKELLDTEKYHKFEVEMSDEEAERFVEIGLERIKEDPEALIQYACVSLLKEYCEELDTGEKEDA
jgi:hypothetical protein